MQEGLDTKQVDLYRNLIHVENPSTQFLVKKLFAAPVSENEVYDVTSNVYWWLAALEQAMKNGKKVFVIYLQRHIAKVLCTFVLEKCVSPAFQENARERTRIEPDIKPRKKINP